MTEMIELELKYRIASEQAAQQMREIASIGLFQVGAFTEKRMTDAYFDTADGAFAAAGYAFRFRQSGSGSSAKNAVELKSIAVAEDVAHRRREIVVATDQPTQPSQWPPGPARELAQAICADDEPQQLFVIEQIRHKADLMQNDKPVAEVSVDQVVWRAGEREWPGWEFEVELYEGQDEAILAEVQRELEILLALAPEHRSKYQHGLALLENAQAETADMPKPKSGIRFRTSEPPLALTQRVVAYHADVFFAQYDGVISGNDPEAVHDARVSTRRMRSALYFFLPWLPAAETKKLRKRLQEAGEALGAVRDLDVNIAYVHEHAARIAPEAEALLRVSLDAERSAARQQMFAYLQSKNYGKLRPMVKEYAALKPAKSQPLRVVLPGLLLQAANEMAMYEGSLHRTCPVEHLHALRITIKRYRYLLEFTRHVTSPACERLIQPLVIMQDHLGDLHDADVGCKLAFSLLRRPDLVYTNQERAALLEYATALFELREQLAATFIDPDTPIPLWRAWMQPQTHTYLDEVMALLND